MTTGCSVAPDSLVSQVFNSAFTIFGQTTAVMEATLARLSRLPDTYQTERLFALPADPQS